MKRRLLAPLLALAIAGPAGAQQRWTGGAIVGAGWPAGTMGDYLGDARGFSMALRRPSAGLVGWRLEAGWMSFGTRTVQRTYNGNGTVPVNITSSARVMTVLGGPEATARLLGTRLRLGAHLGGAHVLTTGSALVPGTPTSAQRASTWPTVTWAAGLRAEASLPLGPLELGADLSFLQLGRTKFLREYNLPIGYISGIYLFPTPYAPAFTTAGLSLRVPL